MLSNSLAADASNAVQAVSRQQAASDHEQASEADQEEQSGVLTCCHHKSAEIVFCIVCPFGICVNKVLQFDICVERASIAACGSMHLWRAVHTNCIGL